MTIARDSFDSIPPPPTETESIHWLLRALRWIDQRARPAFGWGTLALCMWLVMMPAFTLDHNRWIKAQQVQMLLFLFSALAVLVVWLLLGWRGNRTQSGKGQTGRTLGLIGLYLLIGLVLLTQLMVGWLPGPSEMIQTLRSEGGTRFLAVLLAQSIEALSRLLTRILLWRQGVAQGGAAQDELVFALFAGLLLWIVAGASAWLVRLKKQGLLAALPVLTLVSSLLFWGREGRWPLMISVIVALLLHLWLHQQSLRERWERSGIDYSPSVLPDRLLAALGIGTLVFTLTALMPDLYIRSLAIWYYRLSNPINEQIDATRERLFPNLEASSLWRSGGRTSGMPNDFLLGAGPELSQMLVMELRSSDAPVGFEESPPDYYLRAITLSEYDGRGWHNPPSTSLRALPANQPWQTTEPPNRRQLVQSISLYIQSPRLFAAGEAWESSVDSDLELSTAGDLISLRSWEPRYTVVSMVPDVDDAALQAASGWDETHLLPTEAQEYLQLPAMVSSRTRQLAASLVVTATTPYAKAQAIERYLRQFPYDLNVAAPPASVIDVADYFLFDLQRGYCDYYATAFIVLARVVGLPTRMAVGYSPGGWNPYESIWLVSEAQAHAWPEVYFSDYGWIPFEPTAARTLIDRRQINRPLLAAQPRANNTLTQTTESESTWPQWNWNWQILFWLLPLAALLYGCFLLWRRWQRTHEDPWLRLLRWGAKRGRPMQTGDTIVEYGDQLEELFLIEATRPNAIDGWQAAARQVDQISDALSQVRYGTDAERVRASERVEEGWQRVRDYL